MLEWVAISYSKVLLNQGLEPHLLCLLHWQVDSLLLSHLGTQMTEILLVKISRREKNNLDRVAVFPFQVDIYVSYWRPTVKAAGHRSRENITHHEVNG